jgi:hypothetical protein
MIVSSHRLHPDNGAAERRGTDGEPITGEGVVNSLDALQRTFDELRAKYEVTLPAAIADFEAAWRRIVSGEAAASDVLQLYGIVHNISGNAGTFGFQAAGLVAREIDILLKPLCAAQRLPDLAEIERIQSLLGELRLAARRQSPREPLL